MAKRWDYDEITESTEAMIRYHMEQSADARREYSGREYSEIHVGFARGAYLLWSRITMGWQTDGDDERLQGLIARALTEDRK